MMLRICLILYIAAFCQFANANIEGRYISADWFLVTSPDEYSSHLTLGFQFTPKEGWHIYWQNPGESGYAPTVSWHDETITASTLQHPAPSLYELSNIPSYIHEGEVSLLQSLTYEHLPNELNADVDVLVCSDSRCVPETLEFSSRIKDIAFDEQRASKALSKIPMTVRGLAEFIDGGKLFQVRFYNVVNFNIESVRLFPMDENLFSASNPQSWRIEGKDLVVSVFTDGHIDIGAANKNIVAKVLLDDGQEKSFTFPSMEQLPNATSVLSDTHFEAWWAVIGAFLGGILLNLMPCVFPILSLKIFAISQAGISAQVARRDALAYSAGAVISIAALGAFVLALRASGESVGWAFQLQNVYIVFGLYVLMLVMTINLLGTFELPTVGGSVQESKGWVSAFGTGVIAAFIATPCTGPFMAGALGAALVLPMAWAMLVFVALGVGLALPFVVLAYSEFLRKKLPSPGLWMASLRRWLALPMAFTALGLLWILSRQLIMSDLILVFLGSTIISVMLAWIGRRQRHSKNAAWGFVAVFFVTLVFGLSLSSTKSNVDKTMAFDENALAVSLANKQPTFLYFTADWCLTCKVNEATSIENRDVKQAFMQNNVNVIVADWTAGDAKITNFLTKEGAAGVPLYLWFDSEGKKEVLPQVLTPDLLISKANHSDG